MYCVTLKKQTEQNCFCVPTYARLIVKSDCQVQFSSKRVVLRSVQPLQKLSKITHMNKLYFPFLFRITNSLTYYGIMLISSSLAGDRFLNFFLGSVVEYPAAFMEFVLINRLAKPFLNRVVLTLFSVATNSTLTSKMSINSNTCHLALYHQIHKKKVQESTD